MASGDRQRAALLSGAIAAFGVAQLAGGSDSEGGHPYRHTGLGPAVEARWLTAVGRLVAEMRPDLAPQLLAHLGIQGLPVRRQGDYDSGDSADFASSTGSTDSASSLGFADSTDFAEFTDQNLLRGLSIGEIGVVYEALIALSDQHRRRAQGQYFTPDDVAKFLAAQAMEIHQKESNAQGIWLDPCCGVGNLAFHLTAAMPDPAEFISSKLALIDIDPLALKMAQALLVANFAAPDDQKALPALVSRSQARDFLSAAPLPQHDFVIVNPPYSQTERRFDCVTGAIGETYAYFLEKVIRESKGFVAITPAAHLGGKKYRPLRHLLQNTTGGTAFVFDNVPDTVFRGYKYGSTNTSRTNFVRAAITVCAPTPRQWGVTPILRWTNRSRAKMWANAAQYLLPLRFGPNGEWAKIMPGTEKVWDHLAKSSQTLADLVTKERTEYQLEVAATPRYYISATKRSLNRTSKHTLYFKTETEQNRAYILLNSSIPYWWWRCLDGGITLKLQTLLSTPIPENLAVSPNLVAKLAQDEYESIVVKMNAGLACENVQRPGSLVNDIDAILLQGIPYDFTKVYVSDMFSAFSQ
ncbi:MAG: SAM-dependent methyltransferase [Cellulomonadaceae bacterium]|nr:SAM-dependent methyltransferase [Cellulomonadaceae bacterium]